MTNNIIVSKNGDGDFESLTEALRHAQFGSILILKPGLYEEEIEIEKYVNIIGDGSRKDIVIKGSTRCITSDRLIFVKESKLLIKNITIQGGISTDTSEIIVEDCEFYNYYKYGIEINYNSKATISGCKIHDAEDDDDASGIYLDRKSQATVRNSEIYGNSSNGLCIVDGSSVAIFDSKINSNWSGITLVNKSSAYVERCNLLNNSGTSVLNRSLPEAYRSVQTLEKINYTI